MLSLDEEVFDEVVTLLVAGGDTTATAINWALFNIMSEDELFENLRAEVVNKENLPLDQTAVKFFPKIASTFFESLRLVPTVDFYPRELKSIDKSINRNLFIAPCSFLIHRDERNFENAKVFSADRFLNMKTNMPEFLPFGGGRRRCPGANMASEFAITLLSELLKTTPNQYKLTKVPKPIRKNVLIAPSK